MDGYSYLTFDQRREIEALYSDGDRVVDIAAKIGRSVAAIYEELKRGYTGELDENKRVVFTFIRPQRYTFAFMENGDRYTMSFFDEKYRDALKFCGSKSGKDYDKVKETGLTPAFTENGSVYFEEAKLVLECKKMYAQSLNAESITDRESVDKWYDNDFHKMYISEITKVLVKV